MTRSLFDPDDLPEAEAAQQGAGAATEAGGALVEVAVPVPLRRLFTYRVPEALLRGRATLEPGVRVAVPFGGQKLVGVVVGEAPPPEPGMRVRAVAGLLEAAPVFTPELLVFLRKAADYYLHPLGEVLRAAAPALPKDAMRRLRASGFLAGDELLRGKSVATRRELFVSLTHAEAGKLGAAQASLLDALRAAAPEHPDGVPLEAVRVAVKNARATLRALEGKGLVRTEERDVVRDPFWQGSVTRDAPRTPTPEQRAAIDALTEALSRRSPPAFLLEGVTGSGKTEVYLQVIEAARGQGKAALLLVPEIALTPQLVGRFRARFGDGIAVLHSGLSDRERADAWQALRHGRLTLAVGARSALFAPIQNLGVVVVDEEHDPSFKQEEGFRYHARDMAMLRARDAGALCILGSATPSVETRFLAEQGRVERLLLRTRATGQVLPTVEIVDLARNRSGPLSAKVPDAGLLSAPLVRALEKTLANGDQAILFLNRRGFAPSVRCDACGTVAECPTCSVALTLHRGERRLRCHYCDFASTTTESCAACGEPGLRELGMGTEKLEDSLRVAFAGARVARLDRDTAAAPREGDHVLARFARREIDVLVGTQMVTKGHDVPGVTLVGVILADQSLAFPDFRAAERTFQLLSQVAGRAGRAEKPGHVIFQTYQPHHPAIVAAAEHNYDAFYAREVRDRQELGYAPFARMASVRVDAGDERVAEEAARALAAAASVHECVTRGDVLVLGPAPAPIQRLRGRYRQRVLLRGKDRPRLRAVAEHILRRIEEGIAPARATLDIDPVSML